MQFRIRQRVLTMALLLGCCSTEIFQTLHDHNLHLAEHFHTVMILIEFQGHDGIQQNKVKDVLRQVLVC